jgi:catechol 2,3-dioxygenase-like lactoylglutathione lyase family enzyme
MDSTEGDPAMRIQLALNVRNLDEAVAYYAKLFGATPHKRRPGYANFAIDEPPLKLVLLENPSAAERINHLGVEVFEQAEVDGAIARLGGAGLVDKVETEQLCCHAVQNKVWSVEPQGLRWEWYRITDDAPELRAKPAPEPVREQPAAACCG